MRLFLPETALFGKNTFRRAWRRALAPTKAGVKPAAISASSLFRSPAKRVLNSMTKKAGEGSPAFVLFFGLFGLCHADLLDALVVRLQDGDAQVFVAELVAGLGKALV